MKFQIVVPPGIEVPKQQILKNQSKNQVEFKYLLGWYHYLVVKKKYFIGFKMCCF